MADHNSLGFAFTGLKTVQFAIIEEAFRKSGALSIQTSCSFGFNEGENTLIVEVEFNFYKKETPFIKIKVQGYFEIEKNTLKAFFNPEKKEFLFPKKLMVHLTVLTIGATRGILHAKTEGTIYNEFVLPTVNVDALINDDLVFSSQDI